MVSLDGKPVNSMKVVDLKEELRKRGLNLGGLKKDLVERLEASILEEQGKEGGGAGPTEGSEDPTEKSAVAESAEKATEAEEDDEGPPNKEAEPDQNASTEKEQTPLASLPSPPELQTGKGYSEKGQVTEGPSGGTCELEEVAEEAAPEHNKADAVVGSDDGKAPKNSEGQVAGDSEIVTEESKGEALAEDWVLVQHPPPEAADVALEKPAQKVAAPSADVDMEEAPEKVGEPMVTEEAVTEALPLLEKKEEKAAPKEAEPKTEAAPVLKAMVEEEEETVKDKPAQGGLKRGKEEEPRGGGDDSAPKRLRRTPLETPPPPPRTEEAKEGGSGSGGLRARMDAKLFPAVSARLGVPLKNNGSGEKALRPSDKSNGASAVREVPPPNRTPTTSLLISNFLRPFTDKALKELLAKTGSVEKLWLASIKTHCYVTFSEVAEAEATRNALHNLQWPPQHGKLLQVSFVEPKDVDNAVEKGTAGPSPLPPPPAPPPGSAGNDPPAPRIISPVLPPPPRERLPPPPKREPEPALPSLDDLFKKTKAKPHLYFLPLTDEQVAAKLAARKAVGDVKHPGPDKAGRK